MLDLKAFSDKVSEIVNEVSKSVVAVFTVRYGYDIFFNPIAVKGAGSGFIISPDGLIITNNHVITGFDRIIVVTPDGKKYEGLVVAKAPWKDLALVRIHASNLKPLKLGNSDKVRIGEIVFAIGNPLGLWAGPTITMGVVSAVGRSIEVSKGFVLEDLIQTDAAINPGNSGGPLVNVEGEAIGITTAIIPYAQGIGFAIPINEVKDFINMVMKYGRAVRAWIGIYGTNITPEIAKAYDLPVEEGVMIIKVTPGGPAERSGLKEADIIVEVDGVKIKSLKDLRKTLEKAIDKGYVTLEIIRGWRSFKVEVPLAIE